MINCGSSSLKYSFFDTEHPENNTRGCVERIGQSNTRLVQRSEKGEVVRDLPQGEHANAFLAMRDALLDQGAGVLRDVSSISVVGHRVVHGGEKFTSATLIDDAVLAELEALSPLAPLHNPVNVAGIREARRVFPAVPHVAVFDTAFHATLPSQAFLYGLPNEFYEKKGVRRYGFHGSSHQYVAAGRGAVSPAASARAEDRQLSSRQRRLDLRDRSRPLESTPRWASRRTKG